MRGFINEPINFSKSQGIQAVQEAKLDDNLQGRERFRKRLSNNRKRKTIVVSPYFEIGNDVDSSVEMRNMKSIIMKRSGEGDRQDAKKRVTSPYFNKVNDSEASDELKRKKRKTGKEDGQNSEERRVSPYFQKAVDVERSVDYHGKTKSRTGSAYNIGKRGTSPYFSTNHEVCYVIEETETTEKRGEGRREGAEQTVVSPYSNKVNGAKASDEKERQKSKRKKRKADEPNPRERVVSPYFEKGNDVEREGMGRKKKSRMLSAQKTVTSPYFANNEGDYEDNKSNKTSGDGKDAEKRLVCPYFNQVIEIEASDEQDIKGRKKRKEEGQNVQQRVTSPYFNNVNDVEASEKKEKRRKDDRLVETRVVSPYFNEINNVEIHDKTEEKARKNGKEDGSIDGENSAKTKEKRESDPLVSQSSPREEEEVKDIELQNAGVLADRTEQNVLSNKEPSQQKCCQESVATGARRNLQAMLARLQYRVNGTRSHLKDGKHQKPESELHDDFTCVNIEEPEDTEGQEDRRVSPYFQKSTRQQADAKGRQKRQVKAPKPHRKSKNAVRKVSPYFQKAPESEECDSSTNCKSLERKKKESKKNFLPASEKFNEAYRRKSPDNMWKPPRSTYALLQEDHAHDPWRVLVICMLLNVTTGLQVGRVLEDFFTLCPNAKAATETAEEEIVKVVRSLGLYRKRASQIRRLSQEYLEETWTHVTQLHGVGKYGADAYAIFCTGMWKQVIPEDHMLSHYWLFLHRIDGLLGHGV